MRSIKLYFYFTFFRFLLLMSRDCKPNYNYGMVLVLFTYSIILFILPVFFLLMWYFNQFIELGFLYSISLFIWLFNFILTVKKHKEVYFYFINRKKINKYSALSIVLLGKIFFFGCFLIYTQMSK